MRGDEVSGSADEIGSEAISGGTGPDGGWIGRDRGGSGPDTGANRPLPGGPGNAARSPSGSYLPPLEAQWPAEAGQPDPPAEPVRSVWEPAPRADQPPAEPIRSVWEPARPARPAHPAAEPDGPVYGWAAPVREPAAPVGEVASPHVASPAPQTFPSGKRSAAGDSSIRLIWIYPDLLSTYGDRGNLLMLERRARLRGIEVEPVEVNADQPVPRQGDIYLLGGGEDLPQVLAVRRLRADGGLTAVADRGAVIFAVCAGYQLIGTVFGGAHGEPVEGLGILNIRSGRGERRGVGEIVADVDPSLGVDRLTGFENHQGVTSLGRGVAPLARVVLGVGNGDGTEGAVAGRVLGTYLHGPALVRNPALTDLLLTWAAGPLPPLPATEEIWTGRLRSERLAAVSV
jgi:lipid II isoglutaminyl synthase (glutamine-hydrolysing)